MKPRISIVTLSFNQARFLERAILSIVEQGYDNLDYIIVDPGSTDGSRDIIARYRDRITTVLLDPDKGPADGLNKGFAAATGEVFGYINADDLMLPGSLSTIARYFDDPDIDAILGNAIQIDIDGGFTRNLQSTPFSLTDLGLDVMTFVQHGHYFRRRAFVAAGGFNIENRTCWDGELLADMGLAGVAMLNVPERLGAFRLYGDTISGGGRLSEQLAIDLKRLRAKALGRAPGTGDRWQAGARRLLRRVTHPMASLEGLRLRWSAAPRD